MSESIVFGADDRLLVFAPHPDDESIATGGLLQAALCAGASVRVIVATDGDNNPWPQRYIEKRWRIGAVERARWGARRRAEAGAALKVLGVQAADVRFLGLPDLGLTDLLMHADPAAGDPLRDAVDQFQPTVIALPAMNDRHPDHSALHVLLRLVLRGYPGPAPRLLAFGVHGRVLDASDAELRLSAEQIDRKRRAISSHTSQMRLSGKRFLAYATDTEHFEILGRSSAENSSHPLHLMLDRDGNLQVGIDAVRWQGGVAKYSALIIAVATDGTYIRCRVALDAGVGTAIDCRTGKSIAIGISGVRDFPRLPLSVALGGAPAQVFVKIARRRASIFVFDRAGWQSATVRSS